jgi:Zn-dependent protease with chaperone function
MAIELAQRYEQISPKAYEHPADRAATSALHAIPLLDQVIKRFTDLNHERRLRQIIIGNSVRIGEDQVPDAWRSYVACASILDLPAVPNLYVVNDPGVNAMTLGAKTPIVVVNSSLLGGYRPNEVQTVFAHELGHVLSEHYYYMTALVLLKQIMEGALPKNLLLGLPVRGMYLALLEWARAAELSSDRAAALVMGDPLEPCGVLMRIAGGALPGMSLDAFLRQATEYHEEDDLFARHARFWVELTLTHPIAVRRVKELIDWVQAGDYDRIRSGNYPRRGQEPDPSTEFSAAVAHYRERFNGVVDRTAGSVTEMSRSFAAWLRKRPEDQQGDFDEDD